MIDMANGGAYDPFTNYCMQIISIKNTFLKL